MDINNPSKKPEEETISFSIWVLRNSKLQEYIENLEINIKKIYPDISTYSITASCKNNVIKVGALFSTEQVRTLSYLLIEDENAMGIINAIEVFMKQQTVEETKKILFVEKVKYYSSSGSKLKK